MNTAEGYTYGNGYITKVKGLLIFHLLTDKTGLLKIAQTIMKMLYQKPDLLLQRPRQT
jgi:hypothetical protein